MNNNKDTLQSRISVALVLANLCVLSLFVIGWSKTPSPAVNFQGKRKMVIKELGPPNEPVEIVELKVKDQNVKLGEAFEADSDWIEKLTFKIKNRSETPISFVRLDLLFPETTSTGPMMVHQLFVGQYPDPLWTFENPPLYLMPNEAIEISLNSQFERIETLVKFRYPSIDSISKIAIGLGEAIFADETLYSGGNLFKRNPDPASPRKWIRVANKRNPQLNN